MKKIKSVFCIFIPVFIALVVIIGVFVPFALKDASQNDEIRHFDAEETGASTADRSQKGGAIYVDAGANYVMNGGVISGKRNVYGGAVYVGKGATFTMNGGMITKCEAKYGGAIYIENGGECIINGGEITDNTASVAPAIYVENGGKLTVLGNSNIKNNVVGRWLPFEIGEEMEFGALGSGIKLKTVQYGTYPQTIVGFEQNQELESWYNATSPVGIKFLESHENEYMGAVGQSAIGLELDNSELEVFEYIDGKSYLRTTLINEEYYGIFSDSQIDYYEIGDAVWFKFEPITWFILNYDTADADGYYELLSAVALFQNTNHIDTISSNADTDFLSTSIYEMLHYAGVFLGQSQINRSDLVPFKEKDNRNPSSSEILFTIPSVEDFFGETGKYYSLFSVPEAGICSPSDLVIARSQYVNQWGGHSATIFNTNIDCVYWLCGTYSLSLGVVESIVGNGYVDTIQLSNHSKLPTRIMIRV